jgi:tetratricopeptide (TPR) repeat protein
MTTVSQFLRMHSRHDDFNFLAQLSQPRIISDDETNIWDDMQDGTMSSLEPAPSTTAPWIVRAKNFQKKLMSPPVRVRPVSNIAVNEESDGEDKEYCHNHNILMTTITADFVTAQNAIILEAIQVFNNGLVHQINGDMFFAKQLFEQASYAVRHVLGIFTGSPPTVVMELAMRTHNNLGLINYVEFKHEIAIASFEVAICFAKQLAVMSNDYKLEYATTLSNWCRVACVWGDTSDSVYEKLKQIVDIRVAILPWDHPDLAIAYYNIAVVEYSRRNVSEAVSNILKYLDIASYRSEVQKINDLDKMPAIIFHLLIQNEGKCDDVSRNIVQMLLTLQVKRQNGACTPLELASILNVLGSLLFKQHEYENALVFFREELRIEENSYLAEESLSWEQTTALCVTCNNIGRIMQELGQYQEATEYYKRVLSAEYGDIDKVTPSSINTSNLRTELIGVANASQIPLAAANLYSTVWYNYGLVQDKLGLYDNAIRSFQISLHLRQDFLGRDHPDVACLLYNIGVLQMEQTRLDEASASLRETIRIRHAKGESQLNDKHIMKALERLSSLYEAKGDFIKAIDVLKNVVLIQESTREFDNITRSKKLGATLRCISEMLLSLNKLSPAIEAASASVQYHRFVVQQQENVPRDSIDTILECVTNIEQLVSTLLLLGSLHHEMCEPLQATTVMKEAAIITENVTRSLNKTRDCDCPVSLLVMLEVTSMLAVGCCAPEA